MNMLGFGSVGASGGDVYAKLLQLCPGESIAFGTAGKFLSAVGKEAAIGGQYMLAITSSGRLVIGDMQTMNPALARAFSPGMVRIEDRGYLDEQRGVLGASAAYTQAGPTGAMERVRVLAFTPQEGAPFMLFAVASVVPQVLAWGSPR
ncbi:MAG: hypothetical protein IPG50_24415 [Myxococcales bacterium]|nr:hypothetical protein [Myxococcales bacterium]